MARVSVSPAPGQPDALTGVYLLHAERPHPRYGWQHYIGWSRNLECRLAAHQRGDGARVTREWRRAGIAFEVVRVWPGASQADERRLQRARGGNLCPACLPVGGRPVGQRPPRSPPSFFSNAWFSAPPGGAA